MGALEIYETYFKKKYDVIEGILEYYLQKDKTVAIWGAGMRGRAFLKVFDLNKEKIKYVFDRNEKIYGKILETGHEIVDFCKHEVDIVVIVNGKLENSILCDLEKADKKSEILNIDNVILGNLSKDDILCPSPVLKENIGNIKVAAVVVLYNPDIFVIENIKSYVKEVDKLYVHDNSSKLHKNFKEIICKLGNVEYFFHGENWGLSIPFNTYYKKAIDEKMDWIITFDQDSQADEGMIISMKNFAKSEHCKKNIGIIAPVIRESKQKDFNHTSYYVSNYVYADLVIQSGMMQRLDMMEEVGGYDENLFIDEVDFEFCVRCRHKGYSIVILNDAVLIHNYMDDNIKREYVDGKFLDLNKYSPLRYYYRYRNALYCYDKYHNIDLIYGLECENTIRKIEKMLEYDDSYEQKLYMIKRAKYDFIHHFMGKFN